MRRLVVPTVAALVVGAALVLASYLDVAATRSLIGVSCRGPSVARLASIGARVLGRVAANTVRAANAQEVLQFKPVPPESVTSLESRRARRHTSASTAPAPPTPPSVSAPSEPSESESEPDSESGPDEKDTDVVIGKLGNVMRIGSDVHVPRDQVISGDLLVVGGDITIDGHVEGDAVAMGGNVLLRSTARVDGDVASIGGQLTEEPGASVGGQRVTAMGGRGLRHMRGRLPGEVRHTVHTAAHVAASFVWLMILIAVAWGFSQVAPGKTSAALATLKRETALSIGVGALVWALIIPSLVALCLVVAILCITIIGIPLALAALLGYCLFLGLMFVWGFVVAAARVGEWVLSRRRAPAYGVMAPSTAIEPSLTRKAVIGVLVISGSGFFGQILKTLFFAPPLQGLGMFLSVVSIVAGGLASTFGAGAWLRTELTTGTLARWWGGRKSAPPPAGPGAPPYPPVPPPSGTPPYVPPSSAPPYTPPSSAPPYAGPGSAPPPYAPPASPPSPYAPPGTPGPEASGGPMGTPPPA